MVNNVVYEVEPNVHTAHHSDVTTHIRGCDKMTPDKAAGLVQRLRDNGVPVDIQATSRDTSLVPQGDLTVISRHIPDSKLGDVIGDLRNAFRDIDPNIQEVKDHRPFPSLSCPPTSRQESNRSPG